MAQQLLQHRLRQAGVDAVSVASAGVFAVEGMGPTHETLRVLKEQGITCEGHTARTLTPTMIEAADIIFVMEPFQLNEVLRRSPKARGKVHLLRQFGLPNEEVMEAPSIPDPIGKPLEVYEVCFRQICDAMEHVGKELGLKS